MKSKNIAFYTLLGLAVSLGSGCKDDPPPPPPTPVSTSSAKSPQSELAKHAPAMVRTVRLSTEAMKRFRVETCYFGSIGLQHARDAYMSSLAGAEPGPGKIPKFGDDAKPKMGAQPRQLAMFRGRHSPYARHVRSCTVAKSIHKGKTPELDKGIAVFAPYARDLNKALLDARKYYARKQYEKDEFLRGKQLHKRLGSLFTKLDGKIAAFGTAVSAWRAGWGPLPEKLDELAASSQTAVGDARGVTLLCLGDTVDKVALDASLAKLKASRDALASKRDGATDIGRLNSVQTKLDKLREEAGKVVPSASKKLSSAQLYPVASAMADTIEANHRALSKMIRRRAATGSPSPLRLDKPRIEHVAPLGKDIRHLSTKPYHSPDIKKK